MHDGFVKAHVYHDTLNLTSGRAGQGGGEHEEGGVLGCQGGGGRGRGGALGPRSSPGTPPSSRSCSRCLQIKVNYE